MKTEQQIKDYFKAASNETLKALHNEFKTSQFANDYVVAKDFLEFCYNDEFNDLTSIAIKVLNLQTYFIDELITRI